MQPMGPVHPLVLRAGRLCVFSKPIGLSAGSPTACKNAKAAVLRGTAPAPNAVK